MGLSLQKSPLVAQVRVYLFLIPLLTTLQVAHPTTVLVNLALAPVLSALAFPASLVCFFVPQMSQLVDFFWSGAHGLLQWVQQEVSLGGAPPGATAGEWTWLYVGGLQLLLLSLYTAKKRKSLASL